MAFFVASTALVACVDYLAPGLLPSPNPITVLVSTEHGFELTTQI